MIGIESIGIYLPNNRVDNNSLVERFSLEPGFIEEKLGVVNTSKKSPEQETSDLCVEAYRALETELGKDLSSIDCLIVCTQNPDKNGLPHTSAIVHKKLGLDINCAVFDISLGCSGYVYGLAIIESLMKCQGMTKGVLITADPYSKVIDPEDKNTCLLFGDAATATLISEQPVLVSQAFKFGSKGNGGEALNNDGAHLVMDGRAIFNFALTAVPQQVNELLAEQHLTHDEIDLFLFHQGSKFMVEKLIQRVGDIADKAPFSIEDYGNTVSSSIPILLASNLSNSSQRTLLMSGFGVGLSWASAIYNRVD